MAQARKRTQVPKKSLRSRDKVQTREREPNGFEQRLHEAGAIFLFALTSYLLICLVTYNMSDSGFTHINSNNKNIANYGGQLGAWFSDVMYYFFGYLSYWIPVSLFYAAYRSYAKRAEELVFDWLPWIIRTTGFLLALFSGSALASLYVGYINHIITLNPLIMGPGGLLGKIISIGFVNLFNNIGATVLLSAGFFIGVTLVTGLSWILVLDYTGQKVLKLSYKIKLLGKSFLKAVKSRFKNKNNNKNKLEQDFDYKPIRSIHPRALNNQEEPEQKLLSLPIAPSKFKTNLDKIEQVILKPKNLNKAKQLPIASLSPDGMPDVGLLETPTITEGVGYSDAELHDLSRLVEFKLLDFGVEAQVVGVQPGPVVVRFELSLAPGIKVSKVSGLAKDIARSLAIVSVRVVEVIPGKPYVGLEVPNTHREIVRLRELLEHPEYTKNKSPLTLVLGKDISGKIKLADLTKMPHLLVAGTTGSGKSVGVNAMLLSILFKATPKDVRLIMIDPKMLELSVYDGIPHLLAPVVTDMRDAANALKWCVAEMDRRYKLMAALGVRNLASYNRKIEEAKQKNEPILDPLWPEDIDEKAPELEVLPFIVVIVDEFADMIMVVGRKVEELIARIAQKARAAGIHMILATQRPSVDVITGLIKANVPTRIAFQVSSKIDSRTILDQQGAEQLLGQGDMLYLAPGSGLPVRVHGAFVSDQEVHAVADDWRARQAPDYNEDITNNNFSIPGLPKLSTDDYDSGSENDPLYDQAVQFVLESRKASISSVQRRFKIGYNRAANIIEQMESAGILSGSGSKGGREILIPEGQGIN
ncbi:MAG: DNA translocase FtsK 4TM domain-containing protein [Gammaproteobacteria bacterium]|nr:DNA translocase FtsK 4TM domain-containing protein [Gammaproteobacteria bacterium]